MIFTAKGKPVLPFLPKSYLAEVADCLKLITSRYEVCGKKGRREAFAKEFATGKGKQKREFLYN